MERRRLGDEGSRSGREDGKGGTKEARLEGETAFRRPRPRIPSNHGLLSAMKLPPQTVCACACARETQRERLRENEVTPLDQAEDP